MVPLTKEEVLEKLEEYNNMPSVEKNHFYHFKDVEIGDVNFDGFKFEGDVDFTGAKFNGKANFIKAQFNGKASFLVTQFSKEANFSGAQFSKEANFLVTQFSGKAIFFKTQFSEETTFLRTQFIKGANFGEARFTKRTYFNRVRFKEETYFIEAQFNEEAIFWRTQFIEGAHFSGVQFNKMADFVGAQFLGKTTFFGYDGIKIENEVLPENYIFKQYAGFSNITLGPEKLFFKKVNLSKCSFFDTDLTNVDFTGVQWAKLPVFLNRGKRKALYDEVNSDANSYPLVEKLYQQLKLNYEKKGSYPEAGDFHFGEMEMKRKQLNNWWRRNILSFIPWYKYLSGYGEKYGIALFWLLIILFVFSILYLFSGLRPLIIGESFNWDFSFNITSLKAMFSKEFINNFYDSLIYSFQTMTFQRSKYFEPIGRCSITLHVIQSIIGPLQIALFALALRRRFKR